VERDPRNAPCRLKLAQTLNQLGRHTESIHILRSLREESPGEAILLWGLAQNELRRGNPKEALQWLAKYTRARPGDSSGYAFLGRAHADIGSYDLAEQSYRRALSIDSHNFLAWLWLGQVLVATGRRPQAEEPLARYNLLRSLEEEVRRHQRTLLRKPQDLDALVGLARARSRLGRDGEALVPLRKALELHPDNEELRAFYEEIAKRLQSSSP
jgi:Flp pilus assembly protein TadD